jgi:hypothetical protein
MEPWLAQLLKETPLDAVFLEKLLVGDVLDIRSAVIHASE